MEVLTFFRGRKGDVIARLPNGKIVLIDKNYGGCVKAGEKWVCEVREFERFAIATPIERVLKVPVGYRVIYKCGHSEVKRSIGYEEVRESEVQEGYYISYEFNSDSLCPECRKNCKHENSEVKVDSWNFGFKICRICKDCEKKWILYDFTDERLNEKGFLNFSEDELRLFEERLKKEIKEQEIREQALKEFQRIKNWVIEYDRMLKKEDELEEKMRAITAEIRRITGAKEVEIISENEVRGWFGKIIEVVTGCLGIGIGGRKLYETSPEKLFEPIEITPEIQKLVKEYLRLKKELRKVQDWLVENRPAE